MPACRISAALPPSRPLIYGCLSPLSATSTPSTLQQMGFGYLLRESNVPKPVKYNKQGANCLEVGSDCDLLVTEET